MFNDTKVMSFKFDEISQTIEVTFRTPSHGIYVSIPGGPVPDKVWKEIYGIKDGKIALLEIVEGIHIPLRIVDEKFSFGN
jgi:hypothetical protein